MASGQKWPVYDSAKTVDSTVEIVVQLSGKVRGKLVLPVGLAQEEVLNRAHADPKISALLEGKQIVKEIYVKDKLVNIVAK